MTASWRVGPARPPVPAPEVHVWRVELDGASSRSELELPAEERERAAAIRHDRTRQRWVAARWALRLVLGRYLDEDPARIVLQLGSHGKPALATSPAPLRFNLSHSGELALIAVAAEREVGIDVERIDPARRVADLAGIGLGEEEAAAVRAAAPEARVSLFYDAWVRREAIAKCLGVGLAAPLPSLPVAITGLDTDPGYAAAIAVSGEPMAPLRRFQLAL